MVYNIYIQSNVAKEVTLHPNIMKTLRIIGWSVLFAGLAYGGVKYSNSGMNWWSSASKAQMYEKRLQPKIGGYYSVQSIDKNFVIGKIVRPEIGGKVSEIGQLVTIEIPPAKGTGLMKGPYLTITVENDTEVTKFFLDQQAVVQHALDN